ncbi:hypothetical protein K504DRAFT_452418 [Pleomassaria siparia CBS 279.74]|uniref:Uncharacterized protein n=1 Tax=Pleomassaria siparia CBS 279.74 TaxID=1314801 RepID=A0A6G1KIG4_9PLEO|nr:hypothetical protein K504DRAFT_452418 [Pleomassaria siparia CBS 279.74]
MDEPARKRRRTTPPEERERYSSPLKEPPRRPYFQESSPLKKSAKRPPSFASPTKASLARVNPTLLSTLATTRRNGRGEGLNKVKQAVQTEYNGTKDRMNVDGGPVVQSHELVQASAGAEQQNVFQLRNTMPRSQRMTTSSPTDLEEEDETALQSVRTSMHQDSLPGDAMFSSPSKRPSLGKVTTNDPLLNPIVQQRHKGKRARPLDEPVANENPRDGPRERRQPPDPELEKRMREKKQLSIELERLEVEVKECAEVIGQLEDLSHIEGKYSQRDTLIAFINQISNSDASAEVTQKPVLSNLLCSFLPFTVHNIPSPHVKSTQQKPVYSHCPLELEDPLPCLKLFTSLDFTSQVRPSGKSGRHRKHTINITDATKLLNVIVTPVINSTTQEVIHLSIELPPWAERDLGDFMSRRAQEKDLSTVCWALGSYWELSKRRAELWHRCETTFAHLMPGRTNGDGHKTTQHLTRKDLRRHLGRNVLIFEDKHVVLNINWRVTFDWTGEAESEISVHSALPKVWSEADNENSLQKIPEMFNTLVQKRGAFGAIQIVVMLLFDT